MSLFTWAVRHESPALTRLPEPSVAGVMENWGQRFARDAKGHLWGVGTRLSSLIYCSRKVSATGQKCDHRTCSAQCREFTYLQYRLPFM